MKKLITGLMFVAMALCVCMFVAPAIADDGKPVIQCRENIDCNTGLDLFCAKDPLCVKDNDRDEFGQCQFQNPCAIFNDRPVCNWDTNTCVECINDRECDNRDFPENRPEFQPDGACKDNVCVDCVEDKDCPLGHNSYGSCVNNVCQECVVNADCAAGERCGSIGICEADGPQQCEDSHDCNNPPFGSSNGFCAPEGHCRFSGICEYVANQCTEFGKQCVEDRTNPNAGQCVWCLASRGNADCVNWDHDHIDETNGPICTSGGFCEECDNATDCEQFFCDGPSICLADKTCTTTKDYVDPSFDKCPRAPNDFCDEIKNRCVPDCAVDDDCYDWDNDTMDEPFCNGTDVCNSAGQCVLSGNPCPVTCIGDGSGGDHLGPCFDCNTNADCLLVPEFVAQGKTVCQEIKDPILGVVTTKLCVECLTDKDCPDFGSCIADGEAGEVEGRNTCKDCRNSDDCSVDKPECLDNGHEHFDGKKIDIPYEWQNMCVECTEDRDCDDKDTGKVGECETWKTDVQGHLVLDNATKQPIPVFECVECFKNSDCDRERFGKDACLTEGVCDNETRMCSFTNPCGDKVCYPAGFDDGRDDRTDVELSRNIPYFCTNCLNDAECSDGKWCNGVETCASKGECAPSAAPCDDAQLCVEASKECLNVECKTDANCEFFEGCNAGYECQPKPATCGLAISPKAMKADKIRDGKQKVTITGIKGETFDANAPSNFGEQIKEKAGSVNVKNGKRKSLLEPISGAVIQAGTTITVRLGDCEGTVNIQ